MLAMYAKQNLTNPQTKLPSETTTTVQKNLSFAGKKKLHKHNEELGKQQAICSRTYLEQDLEILLR